MLRCVYGGGRAQVVEVREVRETSIESIDGLRLTKRKKNHVINARAHTMVTVHNFTTCKF